MKKRYLFALSLFCFNVQALEMYQWVDEDGATQVTETPPPEGIEFSTMDIDMPEPSETDSAPVEESVPELDEDDEKVVDKARKILEDENCKVSQNNMKNLRNNANLVVPDEKNPKSFVKMTEEVRQEKIKQTQADIDQYCEKTGDEEVDIDEEEIYGDEEVETDAQTEE